MKKLTFLLALMTILLATSVEAQIAPDQARNYQINATHSGSVYSEGVVPPLKQKWVVSFGQPISYPLIADGRVFVTIRHESGNGTRLVGLNATNGAILWGYSLGAYSAWSALCYENGRVFAINGDGVLRAFDAANGNVIWTRQLPGQYSFTSAPTVFQGVIYTGGAGSGGTAYAVSAATGDVLWTAPVANGSQSSPAVNSQGVYLSYSCPNVYKLNPANGAVLWHYTTGCSGGGGKTPALYNERLYVRDYNPDYIFDSETGGLAGSFTSKHIPAFWNDMGFFLNGPKPFGSFGTLEGRNVNSNSVVWSFPGDGFLQSSVLVVNDHVYVGSSQGRLYAVDAATGNQAWTTNVGDSIPYVDEQNSSQPLTGFAAGEGILVIPTSTTLIAYEGDHSPTLTWGVPTPAANAYGWNNTPVDIPFTTSANATGSTPTSPVHFTSEGANQSQPVLVTDQSGNNSFFISPFVNIDLTAPMTHSAPSGTQGNGGWYTSSVYVLLAAWDQLSGIQNTFYQVDGGPTQTHVAPFLISSDGSHTINFWSVDVAGNSEPQQSITVNIDKTAPATVAAISGSSFEGGWYRDPAQVTLTATDSLNSVATTYYVVDGGPPQLYSNPINISGNGNHTFAYWSIDAVGNIEPPQLMTIKVDGSAPNTLFAMNGLSGENGWYVSPSVEIALVAFDEHVGLANTFYVVDGGPVQTFAGGSFMLTGNGEHSISFWSVDKAGNEETHQSRTVKIDNVGPTTQNSVTGPVGNGTYYKGPIQMSLSASDNASGVRDIYYRIDGGQVQTYTAPFTVFGDGTHPVDFWSFDVAGNNTNAYTVMIRIDATAPTTFAALSGSEGPNGWYLGPVQIALAAADDLSGPGNSYYTVDGGATQTYSGPFTISASGVHTVQFWSRDQANNVESPQTKEVKIDATAPTTLAALSGSAGTNGWYVGAVQVALAASDNLSGPINSYFTVDGGATQTYAGPFTISASGIHTVQFWSRDQANNTESPQSREVKIDATAPTTLVGLSGSTGTNGWYVGPVQVGLAPSDNLSGVGNSYYTIDGGATQTYSGPFTISASGVHMVQFWSRDVANNVEAPQSREVKIDATAPSTQAVASGTLGLNGWYQGPVQVSLTATDNLSGIANRYYTINGGATQTFTAPFSISAPGTYNINYWSVDMAGNAGQSQALIIRIDAGAPVISLAANPASAPKSNKPLTVTVSGSVTDAPSGVDMSGTTYSVVDEYGVSQPSGSVVLQTNGTYSFTLSLPATRKGNDSDGHTYTITIQAKDQAGNTGAVSATVRIT
jgi:outer membrane protein assembly factor BamB